MFHWLVCDMTENAYATTSSRECDVYSYGVVLLELITRKKAATDPSYMEGGVLVDWVKSVWRETAEIHQIADSILSGEFADTHIMENVTKVLMVGLRCTEKDPHKRPTMRDVINQLSDSNPRTRSTKG